MKYKIESNNVIETNQDFYIEQKDKFVFSGYTFRVPGNKCSDVIYYKDNIFEGILTAYTKYIDMHFKSILYGKFINDNLMVYVDISSEFLSPFIYAVVKVKNDWYGVKYEYNYNLDGTFNDELFESPDGFIKHTFTPSGLPICKFDTIKMVSNKMNSLLIDEVNNRNYQYFKENFDKEANKVIDAFRQMLNSKFAELVSTDENSQVNEDLIAGSEIWIQIRNYLNSISEQNNLQQGKEKRLVK